jgi:hypothetical protein
MGTVFRHFDTKKYKNIAVNLLDKEKATGYNG